MTKIAFGTFTSAKGNTFQTVSVADVCAILEKALGVPLGGIGTRGDAVLLFPPKAPKSKGAAADERASKGAAGAAVSLKDMQAQMAALMALVQGMAPATPAPRTASRRRAS
jgi:hypothetical protein